jgi:phosphoglycerate-specific signal transduction histidine kinase
MRKLFLQHPRNGGSILATKDGGSKALQNINSVWCFGIKAKLQLSFSAVAFLTAFAVVVSFAGFNAIEGSLQRVVKSEMPAMTNAMRLSVISSNISSEAARFISAKTDDDRLKTMALMKRLRSDLRGSIAVTKDEIGNSLALTNIIGLAQFLDANLEDLEDAILKRTRVREEIDEKIDRLHLVHAQITDDLSHISDPLQRLELSSRVHLLVGLISEGAMQVPRSSRIFLK